MYNLFFNTNLCNDNETIVVGEAIHEKQNRIVIVIVRDGDGDVEETFLKFFTVALRILRLKNYFSEQRMVLLYARIFKV